LTNYGDFFSGEVRYAAADLERGKPASNHTVVTNSLASQSSIVLYTQNGGSALLEGLGANTSLIELEIRQTKCGDSVLHDIQLKLIANRRTRLIRTCDDDYEGEEEEDSEEVEEDDDEETDEEEEETHDAT